MTCDLFFETLNYSFSEHALPQWALLARHLISLLICLTLLVFSLSHLDGLDCVMKGGRYDKISRYNPLISPSCLTKCIYVSMLFFAIISVYDVFCIIVFGSSIIGSPIFLGTVCLFDKIKSILDIGLHSLILIHIIPTGIFLATIGIFKLWSHYLNKP